MLRGSELETIKKMTLFQNLDDKELSIVLNAAVIRTYAKGSEIFSQGDDSLHFYGVLEGWIKVHRMTSSGEQALLGLFGQGETFAEAAMFLNKAYPASAEAAEDCKLCSFSAEAFEKAAATTPKILFAMLGSISLHLHEMTLQVEQLKTRNAKQRTGLFLLNLCGGKPGRHRVKLPYDKSLLAGRLGMTPESLSRNLSALKSVGVTVAGEWVTIEDADRLARFCMTTPLRQKTH